jgi:hypothetical protein
VTDKRGQGVSDRGGGCTDRAGPAPEGMDADKRAMASARAERYPGVRTVRSRSDEGWSEGVRVVRSRSDGGKSDRGNRHARSGAAPLRGAEVAGVEAGVS